MNDPLDDNYLNRLSAIWQAETESTDLPGFRQLQGNLWRDRLGLALELLVSTAGLSFGTYALAHGSPAPGLAAIVYSLAAGGVALWARLSTRRSDLEPTNLRIRSMLAAQSLRVRTGWGGIIVIAMALLFMASLQLMHGGDPGSPQRAWIIAAALVFIAAGMLSSVRTLINATLARERLLQLSRELDRPD